MGASLKSCGTASAVQMVSNRWCKHFTRSRPAYLKISGARPSDPGALPFFNALMTGFTSSSWIGAASASSVGCCGISSNTALSTNEVLFHTCSKMLNPALYNRRWFSQLGISAGILYRCGTSKTGTMHSFKLLIEGPNVMSIGRLLQPPGPVSPPVFLYFSNFGLCS